MTKNLIRSLFGGIVLFSCFALLTCTAERDPRSTVEQYCSAYLAERWDVTANLGTPRTKSMVFLIRNLRAKFTATELTIYNRQKPKKFLVQKVAQSANAADVQVALDGKNPENIHLTRESKLWLIDTDKPLW